MCFITHTLVRGDPANIGALFISINPTCKYWGRAVGDTLKGLRNMGLQPAAAREREHRDSGHSPEVLMTQCQPGML